MIRVLVLNATLKQAPEESNTGELAQLVLDSFPKGDVVADTIRLVDYNIPPGIVYKAGEHDDWPAIADKIKATDVLIMATPIWWGGRSSLIQRVIERMDYIDEEHRHTGRNTLYNKVAGVVITGNEDGAMSVLGSIMMVLTFMGFTLPPGCATYWVGEVGGDMKLDPDKRRANETTKKMAKTLARNLLFYATLLKVHTIDPKS